MSKTELKQRLKLINRHAKTIEKALLRLETVDSADEPLKEIIKLSKIKQEPK